MSSVTSDEALCLLRKVASGEAVPQLKDPDQHWNNPTLDLIVDGWTVVIFTDQGRRNHLDTITAPDGRQGEFQDWRSSELLSQQPEDRLYREDSKSLGRMFQAFRRAPSRTSTPPNALPMAPARAKVN